jgi:hypothetical protein
MSEWLKLGLAIVVTGVAVTLAAMLAAWWFNEPRRLARAFRRALDGAPDAALIAAGTGRGVALGLAARRIVTAWDRGGWRIVYPLDEWIGAELDLDGAVAARAVRGEATKRLDRASGTEGEVRLRLIFDDPGHPDFELALWPSQARRGGFERPREAIAEANRWIARIETLARRAGAAPPAEVARPAPVHRPLPPVGQDVDIFEDDEGELAE